MTPPLIELEGARIEAESLVLKEHLSIASTTTQVLLEGDWFFWFGLLCGTAKVTQGKANSLGQPLSVGQRTGRLAFISTRHPLPDGWPVGRVLLESLRLAGWAHRAARARSLSCLTELGLPQLKDRRVGSLTRYEKALVWVALGLVSEPEAVFVESLFEGLADPEKPYLADLLRYGLGHRAFGIQFFGNEGREVEERLRAMAEEVLLADGQHVLTKGPRALAGSPRGTRYKVTVGRNAGQFFKLLEAEGARVVALGGGSLQSEQQPVGTIGTSIVEVSAPEDLTAMLALSLSQEAPIIELLPIEAPSWMTREEGPTA